jgi:hypothetical protein
LRVARALRAHRHEGRHQALTAAGGIIGKNAHLFLGRRVPTAALTIGIVALHLAITFQVRPNPRWNDAIFVLNYAQSYPDVPLDHHALRIGNLFPARLFLELFGYGQIAYYAWPFLMGILLVLATFALGAVAFDRWTGAAAAILVIFHPVFITTEITYGVERMASWHLLPDIPSTAFFTAGLALLIAGAKRRDAKVNATESAWWFVGAGLCFGEAYLIRELTVFAFPVIALVLLMWRQRLHRWVQVGLPMVMCLAVELVNGYFVYDDPLARLHVGAEHGSPPRTDITRVDASLRLYRVINDYPQTKAVLASFALMIIGALVVRRRGNLLMLAWCLSVWIPLTLVSGLLDPSFIRVNASLMRYWIPILPAACLGAAAAVGALVVLVYRRLPDRFLLPGVVTSGLLLVLLLLAWCVPLVDDIVDNPQDAKWNAVRAYLRTNDRSIDKVIIDDRNALVLAIYRNEPMGGEAAWGATIHPVDHGQRRTPDAPPKSRTVLVWSPELAKQPPRPDTGWRLVLREPELRIYRTGN